MALKKDCVDVASSLTIVDAYHRISRIDDKRDDHAANITVNIYISQEDRELGKSPLPGFGIRNYLLNGNSYDGYLGIDVLNQPNMNHVQQAYEYLKTLPEFQNAIDC